MISIRLDFFPSRFILSCMDNEFFRITSKGKIPKTNRLKGLPDVIVDQLADAIDLAANGDVIILHNEDIKELAKRAHKMLCPEKRLTFRTARQDDLLGKTK